MVDKRLFSLVPGVRGLVVGKIICLWIGLVADIALAGTVTVLVASLFPQMPGVRGLVVGKIICLWIGLVADIALAGTVTVLVASLFPQTSVHSALQSIGISGAP